MPSTVVAAIHYYPEKKVLRVIYLSGSVYDYKDVPEKIYRAMKRSVSKGTYLNNKIKGKFDFEKLGDK
jgi:KTSC domain